jgi:hypothetical protein
MPPKKQEAKIEEPVKKINKGIIASIQTITIKRGTNRRPK